MKYFSMYSPGLETKQGLFDVILGFLKLSDQHFSPAASHVLYIHSMNPSRNQMSFWCAVSRFWCQGTRWKWKGSQQVSWSQTGCFAFEPPPVGWPSSRRACHEVGQLCTNWLRMWYIRDTVQHHERQRTHIHEVLSLIVTSAGFPAERIGDRRPGHSPSIPAGFSRAVRRCVRAQHSGGSHEVPGTGALAAGHGWVVQTLVARAREILHP